jgi:hypothetical protein
LKGWMPCGRSSIWFSWFLEVVPPLPGDKSNRCNGLVAMMAAKFEQTKDLSLNLGKQRVYGLNAKPPAVGRGLFLISILSIAD